MQALAINNTAIIEAQSSLDYSLFDSFVSFIGSTCKKTTQTYLTNLRQFAAWLNYKTISRPVRDDVIAFRDYLSEEHEAIQFDAVMGWKYRTDTAGNRITLKCKAATVALYLRSVCQFFKWTAANGFYPNIADSIPKPKIDKLHKKEALPTDAVQTIEQSISATAADKIAAAATATKDTAGRLERATEQSKRDFAMFVLAVNAGCRTVELERANVKDLEILNGNAYLWIWGKGHSEPDQKKPLAHEVYEVLQDYLSSRTDRFTNNSPLFVATGNRSGGKRIAARTISGILKRAMIAAGYNSPKLTAHSLRHTTGNTVMDITNNNLFDTQMYMRHQDPSTTEGYLHRDTEKQDAAIAQQLYARYHGTEQNDSRTKLEQLLDRMNKAQIEQMASIAAAMTVH